MTLFYTLHDDVTACMAQKDSPANRRSLIRAVFAFVEGFTYRFKLLALEFASHQKNSLSVAELSALSGQTFTVDDNGSIHARRLQISPSANLQLATRLAARCFCVNIPEPAESKVGWNRFNKAVKLRNRITHPKTASDLVVSDAELKLTTHAFMWSISIIALLLAAFAEKRIGEEDPTKISSKQVDTKLDQIRRRYMDAASSIISHIDP